MKDIYYLIKSIVTVFKNKKIFIFLFLIIFLFLFFSHNSFAASGGQVDLYDYYKTNIELCQSIYIESALTYYKENGIFPEQVIDDLNFSKTEGHLAFWNYNMGNLAGIRDYYYNGQNKYQINIGQIIDIETDVTVTSVWMPSVQNSAFDSADFTYPSYKVLEMNRTWTNSNTLGTFYSQTSDKVTSTWYIPSGLVGYYSEDFLEFRTKFYNDEFDEKTTNDWLSMLFDKTSEIDAELEELNEFLNDDTSTDSSKSLSKDNTDNITENGFNDIFTTLYEALTAPSFGNSIDIEIPYTDKSFQINSDITRNILSGSIIYDLIISLWYYLVSLYIVKDISKIINSIKDGSILSKTDTNIKEEML